MKKLTSSLCFKTISVILINCFLLLDIAWAGKMDLSVNKNADTLGAPIQISESDFLNGFIKAQTSAYPELSQVSFGQGYARVYDSKTNQHIGFYVDAIVYVRDENGEFRKDIGAFNPELQTFAKPEQYHSLTIAKIKALIGEKKQSQANRNNSKPQSTPIVESQGPGLRIALLAGTHVFFKHFYNQRFIRFIQPLRSQWYIWRLGLKTDQIIDMFIIQRINSSYNRQELLEGISYSVKYSQNKQKALKLDSAAAESNALFEKRYGDILKKLSRMGTDAFYFKPFKIFKSGTKTGKSNNNSTLQINPLVVTGAFFISAIDKMNNSIWQNLIRLSIFAFSAVVIIYSFLILKKFVRGPIRVKWYVWRLGLKEGQVTDLVIRRMIENSNSRKDLMKEIIAEIDDSRGKEKNKLDRDFEKRSRQLLFDKLYKMGTDAFYLKVLYRIYSHTYRAIYYKRVLKLKAKKKYYDNELLDYVKRGYSKKQLIYSYLKSNLTSTLNERRKATIDMLERFVKAGLLSKQELIYMYLEVLEGSVSIATVDAIIGLKDYIDSADDKTKVEFILKLQEIVKKLEKKIKNNTPLFWKNNRYHHDQVELQKQELLKAQALLIHIGIDVLSDFETSTDLKYIIAAAVSLEGCFKLFGDDVYWQFSGYLNQILNTLIKTQKQLIAQVKPELLKVRISNTINNNNNKKNENVKASLKETAQYIKTVNELLKKLKKTKKKNATVEEKKYLKQNKDNLLKTIGCVILNAPAGFLNNKKPAIGFVEQSI